MKTVKINKNGAGKWADPNTNIPQIEVAEGDVVDVSDALADMIVPCGGKIVEPTKAELQELGDEKLRLEKEAEAQADEDKDAVEALAVAKEGLQNLSDANDLLTKERDGLLQNSEAAAEKILELEEAAKVNGTAIEDLQAELRKVKTDHETVATENANTVEGLKTDLGKANKELETANKKLLAANKKTPAAKDKDKSES